MSHCSWIPSWNLQLWAHMASQHLVFLGCMIGGLPVCIHAVLYIYFQIKKMLLCPINLHTVPHNDKMKTYFLDIFANFLEMKSSIRLFTKVFTSAGASRGYRESFTHNQRVPGAAPSGSSSLLAMCPIKHGWQVEASEGSCPCRFTGDSYRAQQGRWICGENTMLLGCFFSS